MTLGIAVQPDVMRAPFLPASASIWDISTAYRRTYPELDRLIQNIEEKGIDVNNEVRGFKRVTGIYPQEYRKQAHTGSVPMIFR